MSLNDDFKKFCKVIKLDKLAEMENSAAEIAKKMNAYYYDLDKDNSSHLYIVGSVGRGTAVKGSSDLDIIFDMPSDLYKQYDDYETNGQSALLQDVKSVLSERYSKTKIRGDGQVVVVEFNKFTVELVPAFLQSNNSFKYPDTHDGGKWKLTDPLSEQKECENCECDSSGGFYDFCHIMRSWKNTIGFEFGGLLIDTLVYNHFNENNNYQRYGYENYLTIIRNLFDYLKSRDKDQKYWLAVGSNQQVNNSGNGIFVTKAKEAAKKISDTIEADDNINDALIELLGNDFPNGSNTQMSANSAFRNTEQFIEDLFPVDIRYTLQVDCKVTQDGWRDSLLRTILERNGILRRNKSLDFYINKTDCPDPYSIYWKVRNVGKAAEDRDQIRGQIVKASSNSNNHQKEHTDFQGEHFVECYLIKNEVCVARDRIDVPIGVM